MDSSLQLGNRISADGDIGTVKFIGEIESQEGLWLGIEWDDAARGKHCGTYKNVTYFQTDIPNAGSFLRPWKIDAGISCPDAVRQKYGKRETEEESKINLPQKGGQIRMVQMVGFEKVAGKQSQFHQLNEVVVALMCVNSVGNPGELETLIPNATILDLSRNLFVTWSQIADMVGQLSCLHSLVLSKNRLKVETETESHEQAFSGLKTLIMNKMLYSWNDILACSRMWPYIMKLYLCENKISSLEIPSYPVLSKLQCLSLDGNPIASWNEVLKLGAVETLQELYINECQIESVSFPDVLSCEKTEYFPNLHTLYICHNNLSSWVHVAELSKLKLLRYLRITNNPIILSVNLETARQLVIAKLLGLEWLNRTEITRMERRGAEFDYVKRYHHDWLQWCSSQANNAHTPLVFLEEHPSYKVLLQKHGAPEESEISMQTSILKNNLLTIEIYSSLLPNKPPVLKKLPSTMPICKVKGLIQRIFNVSAQDLKLTCLARDDSSKGMDMDNDLRQLSFYSLSDGDKIDVRW